MPKSTYCEINSVIVYCRNIVHRNIAEVLISKIFFWHCLRTFMNRKNMWFQVSFLCKTCITNITFKWPFSLMNWSKVTVILFLRITNLTTFVLKNLHRVFDKYAVARTENNALVKSRTKIFSNFVAFSENPNFTIK